MCSVHTHKDLCAKWTKGLHSFQTLQIFSLMHVLWTKMVRRCKSHSYGPQEGLYLHFAVSSVFLFEFSHPFGLVLGLYFHTVSLVPETPWKIERSLSLFSLCKYAGSTSLVKRRISTFFCVERGSSRTNVQWNLWSAWSLVLTLSPSDSFGL